MISPRSKVQKFILHCLGPTLSSIIAGFIFYQDIVFKGSDISFKFIWLTLVASVFYNLLISVRSRDAYLGLVILLFFTFVLTQSTRPAWILGDILDISSIGTAIVLYVRYFKQNARTNDFYTAVTLAGIYGVLYMVATEVHFVIIRSFISFENTDITCLSVAISNTFFGVVIGFALGGGITLADKFFGAIEIEAREPAPGNTSVQ